MIETVQQLKEHFKPPATQILVNVERKAKYPFIIFGALGHSFDTRSVMPTAATSSLSPELRISDGIYDICGSLTRPGSGFGDDDVSMPLGYIISAFQTFPGKLYSTTFVERIVQCQLGVLFVARSSYMRGDRTRVACISLVMALTGDN